MPFYHQMSKSITQQREIYDTVIFRFLQIRYNFDIYIFIYIHIYIYLIYIKLINSTIQLEKINKNSYQGSCRRHCSLVSRNHFVIRQRLALKINYWLTYLRKFRKILVRFLIKKELVLLILMEVSRSRDFCCWYKSLFQSLDFAWLYTNWLSTKLFQQYVLQLSSAITHLYPFSHQNTHFLQVPMRFWT